MSEFSADFTDNASRKGTGIKVIFYAKLVLFLSLFACSNAQQNLDVDTRTITPELDQAGQEQASGDLPTQQNKDSEEAEDIGVQPTLETSENTDNEDIGDTTDTGDFASDDHEEVLTYDPDLAEAQDEQENILTQDFEAVKDLEIVNIPQDVTGSQSNGFWPDFPAREAHYATLDIYCEQFSSTEPFDDRIATAFYCYNLPQDWQVDGVFYYNSEDIDQQLEKSVEVAWSPSTEILRVFVFDTSFPSSLIEIHYLESEKTLVTLKYGDITDFRRNR